MFLTVGRGSKTPSWKKKFNLTIATPDSSSSPKDQNLRGLSEDRFRQFKAKAQSYIAENQTRVRINVFSLYNINFFIRYKELHEDLTHI